MTKSQELKKEVEKLCNKLSQNYERWGEEVKRNGASKTDHEKFERTREEIEKELKNQVLKDSSFWELDWEGGLVLVPGTLINFKDIIKFSNNNYREEIIRTFIEEIKQNPQDWKIEIENQDHSIGSPSDYQIVKHKSGRKHYRGHQFYNNYRPGFSDKEWTEIENALNSSSNPEIPQPPSKEQQAQQEQSTREI